MDAINKYLIYDGYKLIQSGQVAGKVIYSVTNINPGVQGTIKNIIFASKYKPEIVLEDALNNDIKSLVIKIKDVANDSLTLYKRENDCYE